MYFGEQESTMTDEQKGLLFLLYNTTIDAKLKRNTKRRENCVAPAAPRRRARGKKGRQRRQAATASGNVDALVAMSTNQRKGRRVQQVIDYSNDAGMPVPDGLNENKLLACATNSHVMYENNEVTLTMKAEAALVTAVSGNEMRRVDQLVLKDTTGNTGRNIRMVCNIRFERYKSIGPHYKKPENCEGSNSEQLHCFMSTDRDAIRKTIEQGKQVEAFRKAVQDEYEMGVVERQRWLQAPTVTVTRALELLEESVCDDELKASFSAALLRNDGELPYEDSIIRQQGVLMGTFYISVRVTVRAWFTGPIAACGFGSSHSIMPFNEPRLMELFELSDVGVEASKLIVLLIWAAFDGSIIARELLNYFEVIVPEDNKPGSIKSVFTCWFMVLLGIPLSKIKIRWEESEYANGKNIAYLRIYDRRVLGLLASKILSVVTGYELTYLTHDRLDCSEQNAWLLVGRTRSTRHAG
jgi:hypothetical protein